MSKLSLLIGCGAGILTESDGSCMPVEGLSEGDYVFDLLSGAFVSIVAIKIQTYLPTHFRTEVNTALRRCTNTDGSTFLIAFGEEFIVENTGSCPKTLTDSVLPEELHEPTGFYELTFARRIVCGLGMHTATMMICDAMYDPSCPQQRQNLTLLDWHPTQTGVAASTEAIADRRLSPRFRGNLHTTVEAVNVPHAELRKAWDQ